MSFKGLCRVVSKDVMEELKKVTSTTAWSVLERITGNPLVRDSLRMMNVRPIDPNYKICGPALTVRYVPYNPLNPDPTAQRLLEDYSNNISKLTNMVKPGDVVVAAALGRVDAGVFGEGICQGFMSRGAVGVVTDGGMRDVPFIRRMKFPLFMAGHSTPTTAAYHIHEGKVVGILPTGEINVPVVCDGVLVRAGDIVIGDEDGVIVVPIEFVDEVARRGGAIEDIEDLQRKLIVKGEYIHGQPMSRAQLEKYSMLEKWRIAYPDKPEPE
ncbi:MAG: hypothetical protein QXL67_05185 [Candidatus Bathyarchaeia archaeon]